MAARWTAWLLWAVVAACGVFWGLRLGVGARPVPAHAVTVGTVQAVGADPARLFAAPRAASAPVAALPSAAASRLRLVGLIAPAGVKEPRADGAGLALISVDGKPARAVPLGGRVDGDWVLQALGARSAHVGPAGGATVAVLEVPPLSAAATGVLPVAGNEPLPGAMPPVAPPPLVPAPGVVPAPGAGLPATPAPRAPPPTSPGGAATTPVAPPSS